MNNNYPPGVTGNEPQICGTGTEDKCIRCLNHSEDDAPISAVPDGVIELADQFICMECLKAEMADIGLDFDELMHLGAPQREIMALEATIEILRTQLELKNRLMHEIAEGLGQAKERAVKIMELFGRNEG